MKPYGSKNLLKCGCCYGKSGHSNSKKSERRKAKLEIKKELTNEQNKKKY